MSNAISVKNVTKVYKLYNKPIDRLKESISPFHKRYHEPFYALKDVSFEIKKGETVGIIGTNGSGKSTILKIITGVLKQTTGEVEIEGNISALLELGAGFDMEYTGIENIYMNGAVLGYSVEEMDRKKGEILEFADIGDFVNQPVKTYSSGMLVRLAFALAISVEPEILIIDEALAVGDAFFQAKCFHKLEEIKDKGTTILFVSHDILSVKKLCSKAVWIDKGVLKDMGDSSNICEKYLSMQVEKRNEENSQIVDKLVLDNIADDIEHIAGKKKFKAIDCSKAVEISGTKNAEIESFYIKNEQEKSVNLLKPLEKYDICMVVKCNEDIENVLFGFELESTKGIRILGVNNFLSDRVMKNGKKGKIYEVVFSIICPKICRGEYLITPSVASGNQNNHVVHERIHNFMTILIDNEGYNLSLVEVDSETKIMEYEQEQVMFY